MKNKNIGFVNLKPTGGKMKDFFKRIIITWYAFITLEPMGRHEWSEEKILKVLSLCFIFTFIQGLIIFIIKFIMMGRPLWATVENTLAGCGTVGFMLSAWFLFGCVLDFIRHRDEALHPVQDEGTIKEV